MKALIMDSWTKDNLLKLMVTDATNYHDRYLDTLKKSKEAADETRRYIETLLTQISSTGPGPLIAKTPKVPKRMRPPRIKTIPEGNELEVETSLSETMSSRSSRVDLTTDVSFAQTRSKRATSTKSTSSIKREQSAKLSLKSTKPSMDESDHPKLSETRTKRPKESESSDEEESKRPSKVSKVNTPQKEVKNETRIIDESPEIPTKKSTRSSANTNRQRSTKRKYEESTTDNKTLTGEENARYKDPGNLSSSSIDEPTPKKANTTKKPQSLITSELVVKLETTSIITQSGKKSSAKKIDETAIPNITTNQNETVDYSMYEDAINKPIMNSTFLNPNSTVTLEKLWNATVVIEPIPHAINNETITYPKKSSTSRKNSTKKEIRPSASKKNSFESPRLPPKSAAKKVSKSTLDSLKQVMKNEKFDELMTDDESSPERKEVKKPSKRVTRSSIVSEDEVICTPVKKPYGEGSLLKSSLKNTYKQIALFSPYTKDSVKKRVEAFELAGSSPKQVEMSEPIPRVTRGKTRALASTVEPKSSQKVARKSLAKAIKISLAKQIRDFDETKENELGSVESSVKKKYLLGEKSAQKPLKTTPLGKSRLQPPSSVNRNPHTPSNGPTLTAYSKPLTASRGNIVSHVDSFIQSKSTTKHNSSQDKQLEERKRRAHEEDAKRKREEALKAQTEKKRRKREEKELKNKLAREAKEKSELEKRLKAEKEKEEKAKLALQMQEKQREEMERKKLAQLQRAQEKEEKRRHEEQLRLQHLHEQEEAERLLAEQKRREQEAEKRKQAELRAQNQIAMEAIKLKNQMLTSKSKILKPGGPTSYKIDSEPDDEDSDDEASPKHQIPNWATKHVRQGLLAMQQHVPMMEVLKFFDAKKCTPDLTELFTGIDPRRLKRTSSAIWKTAPRFSMMGDP